MNSYFQAVGLWVIWSW